MDKMAKYLNIKFPFRKSDKGFLLDMNTESMQAIKSDLIHLILTQKGKRYFNPDFGTNLYQYIFDQHDGVSESKVRDEITTAVNKYLPAVSIDDLSIKEDEESELGIRVEIKYTVNEGSFTQSDNVVVSF